MLKVIVETGYLSEAEIRKVTYVVDHAGADFIKTSTGFGPRGASLRDIELFKESSTSLLIKAAGGVRDHEAAKQFIKLGANRIGTSSGTKLIAPAKEGQPQQPATYWNGWVKNQTLILILSWSCRVS